MLWSQVRKLPIYVGGVVLEKSKVPTGSVQISIWAVQSSIKWNKVQFNISQSKTSTPFWTIKWLKYIQRLKNLFDASRRCFLLTLVVFKLQFLSMFRNYTILGGEGSTRPAWPVHSLCPGPPMPTGFKKTCPAANALQNVMTFKTWHIGWQMS